MFYVVYMTVCLINYKIYVGMHKSKKLHDAYLGSGYALKAAIRKYGIENFKRKNLFIYNNSAAMIAKEAEIVTASFVSQDHTYNLIVGGGSIRNKRKHLTEDHKSKIRNSLKGKEFSDERRANLSLSKIGKSLSETHKHSLSVARQGLKNPNYGIKASDETRAKMSASRAGKKRGQYKHNNV